MNRSNPDSSRQAAALRANLRRRRVQAGARAAREARIAAILGFWFDGTGALREAWFKSDPAFDALIRDRFGPEVGAALAGGLADWPARPAGALARLLLLDQFPRNIFRGSPRAYAGDALALAGAAQAVADGIDAALAPVERLFVYLPFVHSERLADQRRALALVEALPEVPWRGDCIASTRRHLEIVERFGRFPHRNAVLGRASTAAELEFLAQPNSSF